MSAIRKTFLFGAIREDKPARSERWRKKDRKPEVRLCDS